MTARFCDQCGKPLMVDDDGQRRCPNGHLRADVLGALRELLPVIRTFRADVLQGLEDHSGEIRSLREVVEALEVVPRATDPAPAADERIELAEMARRLKVSEDWLRRNAERLGGRQDKKGGRWKFDPARTLALFGTSDSSPPPAAPPATPRPLASRVDLLPVKDAAA